MNLFAVKVVRMLLHHLSEVFDLGDRSIEIKKFLLVDDNIITNA